MTHHVGTDGGIVTTADDSGVYVAEGDHNSWPIGGVDLRALLAGKSVSHIEVDMDMQANQKSANMVLGMDNGFGARASWYGFIGDDPDWRSLQTAPTVYAPPNTRGTAYRIEYAANDALDGQAKIMWSIPIRPYATMQIEWLWDVGGGYYFRWLRCLVPSSSSGSPIPNIRARTQGSPTCTWTMTAFA